MEPARTNRKVLPNYLLEDYIPVPDSKPSASSVASGSHAHSDAQHHAESSTRGENGAASATPSEAPDEALGFLPRRKKLRQACVYCRRSHLVCEEKRPCHRCVKRGIADRCVDPPQDGKLDEGAQANGNANGNSGKQKPQHLSPASSANGEDANEGADSTPDRASEAQRGSKRKRKSHPLKPSVAAPPPEHDGKGHQPPFSMNHAAAPEQANFNAASAQRHVMASTLAPESAATYAGLPLTMPVSAAAPAPVPAPAPGRNAPSQLLQGQPIFQPPSSAELDSLFSTYFFDVADSFNARPGAPHPGAPGHHGAPPTAVGGHAMFGSHQQAHPQHHMHAMSSAHASHPVDTGLQPTQPHFDAGVGGAHDPRVPRHAMPVGGGPGVHQQQPLSSRPSHHGAARMPADAEDKSILDAAPNALPTHHGAGVFAGADRSQQGATEDKEAVTRQRPGDVYAPYPYRKGYASLMRYMTEQNWSQQSIRSVEAALSKIRRLWFSLEDNIQPSSMIQLQAEWAGNVRYYSESVLPFTPVPMVVCRKAGEVYASNELAHELCGRSRDQMTGGKLSCYELMTEASASEFFRLYELAVGGDHAEDGSYVPTVGNTAPLYWNADIVRPNADGTASVRRTRGVFEMKIAPCGLPSLLVCCFVPLS
ncbi:uncharacterized protein PAN0_015c5130 [Moesziomyces antarcticus]|uniref:Related to RDS2 - Transcription factor involved in regulating gluconeogenesis and glyoxylate cycle genes n=2 Tax=Pseudozyma antarctica TaxID=84753 RepID=A0A5C3FWK6_PSEA2|nr:uncharacterized protein PAN0_015c5130 [Moesziomyces antarcticus]GAK66906.1 conserved hypothetical protein [Moesziomyces antarcticus]SPO47957.1 related to RDS2 - Transcription factor involved in regulating gluconeogenesis and glyoxylate cycle genes [Moesziomyces antarcticus]